VVFTLMGSSGHALVHPAAGISVFTARFRPWSCSGSCVAGGGLAVTSGFEHEFQDKVLAVNAHLIVTSYGLERDMAEAERDAQVIKKTLAGLPGLERNVHLQLHRRGSHDLARSAPI